MSNRVAHFEIHADAPERAIRFYSELFGWSFQQFGEAPYWLITTGTGAPGIDGGLVAREGERPVGVGGFVCMVDVADIDATIAAATALGAPVEQDKQPVPGVGWSAYFKDPEGNLFGVFQNDENAA